MTEKKRTAPKGASDRAAPKAQDAKSAKAKGGAAPKPTEAAPPKKTPPAPAAPKGAEEKLSPQKAPSAEVSAPAKKPERKPAEPPKAPAGPVEPRVPARLKVRYRQDGLPPLREQLRDRNGMEVPQLEKEVINKRVGGASTDTPLLDKTLEALN